ncbi:MAG: radical SAM protein, partial [Candidatus Omnitrophota bacterium]
LIPDFLGSKDALGKVCAASVDIISHNLETVPSLYGAVRNGANYFCSLEVLRLVKEMNKKVFTKSGLMLGLGETEKEVIGVLRDLRGVNCDFLTLGQYLAPSAKHYPVKEYVNLEKFAYLEEKAYALGFLKVKSAPYVRSSYMAHDFLNR